MSRYIHRKAGREPGTRPGALAVLFILMVAGFSVLNLFWPKRDMSDLENRKLAQMPAFSVKALLDGSWFEDFGTYVQDQVAFRDDWINLESAFNSLALGKVEESDILLGKDGWMFTKLFDIPASSQTQLTKNLDAVINFASRHPGKVTFLLAPSASVIYLRCFRWALPWPTKTHAGRHFRPGIHHRGCDRPARGVHPGKGPVPVLQDRPSLDTEVLSSL